MFQVSLRESIYDIKSTFKGIKIIILLLAILIIVGFNVMRAEGETLFMLYFFMFGYQLFRLKVNKIQFLLPMNNQQRRMYLYYKNGAYIVLIYLLFLLSHGIIVLFGGYNLSFAAKFIFCEDIPFIMSQFMYILFIGVDTPLKDSPVLFIGSKKKIWHILSWIAFVIPLANLAGFFKWISEKWYVYIVILVYLCGIYMLFYSASIYKELEINFEKLRNRKKTWTL